MKTITENKFIAYSGILYATNETNLCNERFVKEQSKVNQIGLLPNIQFTKN